MKLWREAMGLGKDSTTWHTHRQKVVREPPPETYRVRTMTDLFCTAMSLACKV